MNESGHRVILASLVLRNRRHGEHHDGHDSMTLLATLRKMSADGEVDLLREGVRVLAQAIMEAAVTEITGVPKGRA